MAIQKTRNIPLSELYYNLQLEYISYFLRSKIHCKDFAENYKKICLAKREKIEKISLMNGLPSIFNDSEVKAKMLKDFLNDFGIPNFTYKDESTRSRNERWDRNFYFCKGTSVKLVVEEKTILGVIVNNDKNQRILVISDDNKIEHTVHYNNAARLFPEDFFTFN